MPNESVKGTRRPLAFFEVCFFIKVRWLRFAFVSGAPLTVTLYASPMMDIKLYIYAFASLACLCLGGLALFRKTYWLGKYAPQEQNSPRDEKLIGGVMVFLGVLGTLTSYAVFIRDEPMYFLGFVFELIRWMRVE
jgi:hypothetical protein